MNNKNTTLQHILIRFILSVFILFSVFCFQSTFAQDYDSNLDTAYNYLSSGKTTDAISIFEDHIKNYPDDMKIYLQLAYAYKQVGNESKAKEYFTFVTLRSGDSKDVYAASTELDNLKSSTQTTGSLGSNTSSNIPLNNNSVYSNDDDLLNQAYSSLNQGNYLKAIEIFENYKLRHPNEVKIYLQLGYLYSNQKRYQKAIENFQYVENFSNNFDEIDKARISIYNLRSMQNYYAYRSLDIYFVNMIDSYYQNYISNLLAHVSFRLGRAADIGFYGDAYMDAKSKKGYILNDRYVEAGGFLKLKFSDNIGLEIRTGYAHEIDLEKNSFVFKPILYMGTRVGEAPFYLDRKNFKTEYFYLDVYSAELYDSKYRNLFGQLQLKEVLRYMTGGYSYLEFYLCQTVLADSRQLDYNNYGEFGIGLDFKPNLLHFPALFVEGTNKLFIIGPNGQYFTGDLRNTFQIKAGFIINFNSAL